MPVRKRATPRLKFMVLVVGLALLALAVHTLFGKGGYLDLRRRQAELEQLRQEVKDLQEENRRLTEQIKELKSNPDAIERVAREQLKLARPNETVITLPEKSESDKKPPERKQP